MVTRCIAKGVRFEDMNDGRDITVAFMVAEDEADDLIDIDTDGETSMHPDTARQVSDAILELLEGCHEDGDYADEVKEARGRLVANKVKAATPTKGSVR
jgi:hypothetical protein